MKKLFALLLVLSLLLCGCSSAEAETATLVLTCYDNDVVQELTQEEAEEVSRIFNAMWLGDPGVPACGFGDDVAIKVGNTTYRIAKDDCSSIQKGALTYTISDEDMDYIHGLFEKYTDTEWGYNLRQGTILRLNH